MVSNSCGGPMKKANTQDGKIKGLNIVTGFTNTQNLSWMNSLIIVVELVGSIFSEEFNATAYEWN